MSLTSAEPEQKRRSSMADDANTRLVRLEDLMIGVKEDAAATRTLTRTILNELQGTDSAPGIGKRLSNLELSHAAAEAERKTERRVLATIFLGILSAIGYLLHAVGVDFHFKP